MSKRIGYELHKTQQLIKRYIEQDKKNCDYKLTHSQTRLLLHVHEQKDSVYQKDIESFLKIRRSTATEMLNLLERDGYIIRKRAEHDARLKEIHVTDLTLDHIDKMNDNFSKLEELLRKDIKEEDLNIFFSVLEQLRDNIR